MKKKSYVKICFALSVPFLLSSIGYGSWLINSKEESVVVSGPKVQDVPVAYILGSPDIKYTKIERALDVAKSGDIVIVIPPQKNNYHPTDNAVKPDTVVYEISRGCTVKEGVTLVLPTDKKTISSVTNQSTLNNYIKSMREDDRSHGETTKNTYDYKTSYSRHALNYEGNYLRVTVKIKEGVSLVNNGSIVISGYLSGGASAGPGIRGQTSHSYSQIVLGKNASIVQSGNNSTFHCYGYVKEEEKNNSSFVEFNAGTIYMPLIVNDYKGFQFLSGIQDAVQKQDCSPFNNLEMRNLMCNASFKYGSALFGITNIYYYQSAGTLGTYEDTLHNSFKIIGSGSDALINLTQSLYSSVKAYFDASNNKMKLDFIGGVSVGNLAFKISASGITIDLNTKYGFFPVHYGMEINLCKSPGQTSAEFNSNKQKIKLLPGSVLSIGNGCTLTGSELACLSAFVDGPQGERDDAKWSAGTYYPLKEGAICSLDSGSFLTMNKIGGVIYCDNESNISFTNNSVSVKEGWNQKQSGLQYVTKDYLEMTETAKVTPLSYKSKRKLYLGMNRILDPSSSSSAFTPHLAVLANGEETDFNGTQGIVFLDSINQIRIKLISNVNSVKQSVQNNNGSYPNPELYMLGDISASKNVIACGINSSVSISSNNAGVNEFEVQQITIKSLTNKVNGKDPLYIDGNIYLAAEISNANQAYDKNVVWASLNESIAIIDQDGKVTGKSLGKVIFSATCGGKTAYYESEVIEDSNKIGISDA